MEGGNTLRLCLGGSSLELRGTSWRRVVLNSSYLINVSIDLLCGIFLRYLLGEQY